jgi:hypothetical protein
VSGPWDAPPTATVKAEVREIKVESKGQIYKVLVDADDYERLSRFRWFMTKNKRGYMYAVRSLDRRRQISMHREIMNPPKDRMVDHANGNTLDNRKSNLRVCSRAQNAINSIKARSAEQRFKGVTFNKADQCFHAAITQDRQVKYIGSYRTAMEAALAYDKFAMHIHGEFAKLNFPNAAVCETIKALKAERDHWAKKYGTYVDKWNDENALANVLKAERDRYRKALAGLLADTQHADHKCGEVDCPVEIAREALKENK